MRVLVWNVKGFRLASPRNAAAALGGLDPDLMLVTECGTTRRIREMAGAMGMDAFHGSLPPLLRRVRNAILVRPPLRVGRHGLHRFGRTPWFSPRGVFWAEILHGERAVRAMVTHLGLSDAERRRQTEELLALAGAPSVPLLLGADLNEGPGGPVPAALRSEWNDAWEVSGGADGRTFPSGHPRARIDYLFVSHEFRVGDASVGPSELAAVSDHLPVIVDLGF